MHARIAAFVAERWSVSLDSIRIDVSPLRGGLDAIVARAVVTPTAAGPMLPPRLVVKELRGALSREAAMYRYLAAHMADPPIAALFGTQSAADGTQYLYLEDVPHLSTWPWLDTRITAAVCRELAQLHLHTPVGPTLHWNYERELLESAEETLAVAAAARDRSGARSWRRLGDLRRVVRELPRIRARILGSRTTLIHGDVHPGNVIVRADADTTRIVFIDWGRARIGSPLEDAASWLHSIGCWEPEARRRHDTLLRAYLGDRPLTSDVRSQYWLASASNGLAGAIRHHLVVLNDERSTDGMRYDSWRALQAWQRVIRGAAALLSTTPPR